MNNPTIETIDRYELADVGRVESVPVMAKDPDGSYVRFEDMVAVVAKYKKDAERYRWLRANYDAGTFRFFTIPSKLWDGIIDAQMSAEKK